MWFKVSGTPKAQGSMRHIGGGRMIHSPELIAWRDHVRETVRNTLVEEYPDFEMKPGRGWTVDISFLFPLPAKSFISGDRKRRRPNSPTFHIKRPDLDKLLRAMLDALTGVMWFDDSEVHLLNGRKSWTVDVEGRTLLTANWVEAGENL